MTFAFLINNDTVTCVLNGEQYSAKKNEHMNYDRILDAIREKDIESLPALFNVRQTISEFMDGLVEISDGVLYFDKKPLHNYLSSKIVQFFQDGFDIKPLSRFLSNLQNNPSKTAVDELYLFLEAGNLPITEDGHFLAYKRVRANFHDCYTGKIDNSPGNTVDMPRNEVNDNREIVCSDGLHFCSLEYLPFFGTEAGNKVVIVKINPADVVAIPKDYKNTKGRACKYFVLEEYKNFKGKSYFDKEIYQSDDFENWDKTDACDDFGCGDDANCWCGHNHEEDSGDNNDMLRSRIAELIAQNDALKATANLVYISQVIAENEELIERMRNNIDEYFDEDRAIEIEDTICSLTEELKKIRGEIKDFNGQYSELIETESDVNYICELLSILERRESEIVDEITSLKIELDNVLSGN